MPPRVQGTAGDSYSPRCYASGARGRFPKPAADPWTDRALLGIGREELERDRRDGPVDPRFVAPAEAGDENAVDVHSEIEQEQIRRPLGREAPTEWSLVHEQLEHLGVSLSTPVLVERPEPCGIGVASHAAADHGVEWRR